MKKIVLYLGFLVSFLFVSNEVDATHYMGGQITWVCDANGDYIFTFKIYRDCSGTATLPQMNNQCFLWNYPSAGSSIPITIDNTKSTATNLEPSCRVPNPTFSCASGSAASVTEYVRVSNPVSLIGTPPAQGWIVTFDGNARNSNNNMLNGNVPNPYGITLRAKIFNHSGWDATKCIDNSPDFREDPTAILCGNLTYSYNHNATDEEQDSLAYSWARPLDNFGGTYNEGVNPPFILYEPGFNFDDPYPGSSTLDSVSGEIVATLPSVTANEKYVAVVRVSAYKCGEKVAEVYRELQSVVRNCGSSANNQPQLNAPFRDAMGNLTKFDTVVKAGALIRANVQITDFLAPGQTQWDSIKTFATGSQWGLNFKSASTGCNNPPCATLDIAIDTTTIATSPLTRVFEWQTDCNHVLASDLCLNTANTYNFVITATDDACPLPLSTISTISIKVEADSVIDSPTLNCINVQANGNVDLNWDLSRNVNNSFDAWLIYRSNNFNGPFTIIDSVLTYTTNTYTDVNANANNQQRFYHVRSRSGCKGSVVNVARDTAATMFLSATTNPTNVVVNWNALSNPNPAGSAAQYRVFREYPIGTGFSLYQSTANTSLTETFTPCTDNVRYRVELVNSIGSCTSSSNVLDYTFKFPDPQTNFSFPNNQCPNTPINFTNLTTITGGTITYSWDFGDGSAASTATSPTHTYAVPGNYTVQLTAISGQGCDSVLSQVINVTLPNADAGADQSICPGGTAPIGAPPVAGLTYSWSPTTGLSNANIANPNASPGSTQTYTLSVTDANNCTNTDQVLVTVIPFPTADAGGPRSICPTANVTLGGTPTGPAGATYSWSSNPPGFTSTASNPVVSPTVNTTYTVTVTVGTTTTCSDIDNATVSVIIPPTANAGSDQNICPGTSIQIGSAPSAGFTYSWLPVTGLNNPNISNPIATPASSTRYTLVITETATGCSDDDEVDIFLNPISTPAFTVDKTCINQITEFTDASIIATGSITAWSWDFDDAGATSTAQNPTHQFSAAGTYQVKLVVTSNLGCKDSITNSVTIAPKPTVDFTFTNLCLNDVTQFTDVSTIGSGVINTWRWDFDGLGSSTLQNPTFTFPAAGTYDVKLVSGSGAGCLDSVTKQVVINALPVANAGADQDICPGTSVQIGVAPSAGFTYSWTPTAGLSNPNVANPIATPTSPTTYTVQITETATTCTNTDAMNVTFNAVPSPAFTVNNTCINQVTQFTDASTIATGSITAWEWDFDDAGATSTAQNPTHQFSAAGTYQVKLVVTSNLGCKDSITNSVTIAPKPTVDFTFANLCLNDVTQFTDVSTIGSGVINTWRWDFDGLGSSTLQNPTFTFPAAGTYDVKLVSGSGAGCLDSITKQVVINALPVANAGADQDICPGTSVQIGVAPSAGFTYSWTPTAGLSNPNVANPIATPTSPTTYTVQITETATTCTNTDAMNVTFNAVPSPAFTVNNTCINQVTQFTDASTIATGSITAWEWDFDDAGATSTAQNPTHQFSAAGTYQVKLVVTSNLGCKDSITNSVTIAPKPTVDFTFANLCLNDVTQFTDVSTIGSGVINTWRWDFDGLGSSTLQNPTFTFPAAGTYDVKLVSGSGAGCLDSITKQVIINALPVANAGPDQDICPGTSVQIGVAPSAGFTYSWTPTAGLSNANVANPIATPTSPTTYTVQITETATTCTNTDAMDVTFNAVPNPAYTVSNTCINQVAQFTDASTIATGSITAWVWDFDDAGATSTAQNPTHQFSVAGTYQVKLVATSNLGCKDSITTSVTIAPKPTVDFTFANLCLNDVTQFTDVSTIGSGVINTWRWDFDGLGSSTLQNPTFTFPAAGTYDVKLVSGSGAGCLDSITKQITINPLPTADAGADQNICPGESVRIGTLLPVLPGFTYSWTPTAGLSNPNIASPTATPTSPTTYTVLVTRISTGCTNSDAMDIFFNAVPNPSFNVSNTCINQVTQFTDASTIATGSITAWSWDFDDAGATSTAQNPTHQFSAAGTYQVKLVVTSDLGCKDSITTPIIIDPIPTVDFTFANLCLNDATQFTDASTIASGSVSIWSWDFDGLGSSILQNPTFTFPAAGTYDIKLVSGSGAGCLDSITKQITINPLPTANAGLDQDICNTFSVQIGGTPTSSTPNVSYLWDNATTLDDNTIANPTASPSSTTRYRLTVTENTTGCFDTSSVLIRVNPIPVVDFSVADTCIGNTTVFTDNTTLLSGTITSWSWDFGDGIGNSTQPSPTYTYSAVGSYNVKLVVETAIGCYDSLTKTITVVPLPNVDAGLDQIICDRDTVSIGGTPTSSTAGVTYLWDNSATLNDATLANPLAFPSTTTRYSVTVTETLTGCTDTASVVINVNPVPVAAFTATAVCENELTQFTDGSTIISGTIASWTWDFGDGVGVSTQQNPSYQYATAGTYQVKIVVESALGCKDSITNSIVISPKPIPSFTFTNLCENDITQFTDASTIASGTIASRSWDFGDGVGTSTAQSPTYTFATPNTYNVKLVLVSDFGCTDSITIPVTINPLPLADAGSDQVICNTGSVQIGGSPTSSTPNVSFLWDNATSLNDATLANPTASPIVTTRYKVTVTENTTGCFDTSSVLVTVNPIPVVDFSVADTCVGSTTLFTDLSSLSVGTISAWTWDFGDGVGTSIQQNPSYTYAIANTYSVKLIVESAVGCRDSITKQINITALPNIDAGPDQGICLNDSIRIGGAPTSTGTNVSFAWDNGATLDDNTVANPTAKPSVTTRYSLTVTDQTTGCFDTASVLIRVNPLPNANFRATQVCVNQTTQFTDLSNITTPASIQGWTWDFGDGVGASTQQNPSYLYAASGTYSVKLIVTTNSGCLDSIVRNVTVNSLPLADAGADRTICALDTTILGKPAVVGESYSWNNASSLTDATAAQPGAFPTVDTRYIVTVTNANGCVSIDSVDITVTPAPNVDAGADVTICNRDTITIGGSPTSIEPGATYLWNNAALLDDPTLPNPRAFPNDTTAFVVTVTDALGCSAKDTMIVNVNPLAVVDFRVDAQCDEDFAAFTDISTLAAGNIISWSWTFGDGVGTSILQNPGYQYASAGVYSVSLVVQTSLGCIDSIRKDVTILDLPIATAGADTAICLGDTIALGGNSTRTPGATYSWSPGFELSSVSDSTPMAFPKSSTIYYLTVTGANGCFNFDTINVDVNALPIVTAEKDSSLCVNEPVQLSANGALSYSWSSANYLDDANIANPIARALKSTNFIVTGTDLNGCSARDTVFIDVFNLDFTPVDTSICSGDSVVLAPILQGDTAGITYRWSSSNPSNLLSRRTDSIIKVTANTRQYFTLEIRNALGCVDTDSIYVNMRQPAEVDFDYVSSPRCANTIIEIQNTSTFTDDYVWKLNGEIVSRDRNPNFEINNLVDNSVTLIGTNLTCTDSTTEVIAARGLRDLLDLKDANVFTPNGDGLNDIFDPGFEGEFIGCYNYQIFDRWGDKVFDSNIGQYGWDGVTLRGQPAKTGVYFYIIKIANEEIRGSVYLSR